MMQPHLGHFVGASCGAPVCLWDSTTYSLCEGLLDADVLRC